MQPIPCVLHRSIDTLIRYLLQLLAVLIRNVNTEVTRIRYRAEHVLETVLASDLVDGRVVIRIEQVTQRERSRTHKVVVLCVEVISRRMELRPEITE